MSLIINKIKITLINFPQTEIPLLLSRHYSLSPVKLFQNSRSNPRSMSRVVALVKETSAQSEITRFENLRDKQACFPEFGGIGEWLTYHPAILRFKP